MRKVRVGRWMLALLLAVNGAACTGSVPQGADSPPGPGGSNTSSGVGAGSGAGGGPSGSTCALVGQALVVSDGSGVTPSLAWNGVVLGVTWAALDESEIFAAILSPTGAKIGEVSIAKGPASQEPTIYQDPAGFLVLWSSGGAVMGQRIDTSPKLSGAPIQVSESGSLQPHPKAAPLGTGYLIAFEGPTSGQVGLLSGNAIGNKTSLDGSPAFPAPVSDGTNAGVFWSASNAVDFAEMSSPVALGTKRSVTGQATNKETAMHGTDSYVTWEDTTQGDGNEQIFAAKVTADGAFSSPVAVPSEVASANWPAIAVAGDTIAVAYYQFRSGPPSIFLTLLHPDLSRVTGDFMVSPATESDRFPSVVWTGKELVVAYAEEDGQVKVASVDCD